MQTQPVPIRVDDSFVTLLLGFVVERAGGVVEFTKADLEAYIAKGKGYRVVAEAQRDGFGNLLFDYASIQPLVNQDGPLKVISTKLFPSKEDEDTAPIVNSNGLVN